MSDLISVTLSDTQVDASPPYDRIDPVTNRSTRFAENIEQNDWIIQTGIDRGARLIIHPGDLGEKLNFSNVESEGCAYFFQRGIARGAEIVAVAGNHDAAIAGISGSNFKPLAQMIPERFRVFHTVEYDQKLRCLFLPYIHRASPEEIRLLIVDAYERAFDGDLERAAAHFLTGPVFMVIHYGLQGARMGHDNMMLPGDYLGPDQLLAGLGGSAVDVIIAGHIHKAQQLMVGHARGYHPGSTQIRNMGERADEKCFLMMNHTTREVQMIPIPQKRKWISVPFSADLASAPAPWTENDMVRIDGTYTPPDFPPTILEAMFAAGAPRPFAMKVEVKLQKAERQARSEEISLKDGPRGALANFVRTVFPRRSEKPGIVGPATEAAMAQLQVEGGGVYCPKIYPDTIDILNFMTFGAFSFKFPKGIPCYIEAGNGEGKTNFGGAIMWCLCGKLPKKIPKLEGVVNQAENSAHVSMVLIGDGGEDGEQRFRIMRAVRISPAGSASQKLSLHRWSALKEDFTDDMSDGGKVDVQAIIDNLIGGSAISLRTKNFKIQKDKSPFIDCDIADRKDIIGEVLGLGNVKKAWAALVKIAEKSLKAYETLKAKLDGMNAGAVDEDARLLQFRSQLEKDEADLVTANTGLEPARAAKEEAEEARAKVGGTVSGFEAQIMVMPDVAGPLATATATRDAAVTNFENSRTTLTTQQTALAAEVEVAEGEIAALKVPTAEEMALIESEAAAAREALPVAREADTTAKWNANEARAAVRTARLASTTATTALETAQAELDAVGEVVTPLVPHADAVRGAEQGVKDATAFKEEAERDLTTAKEERATIVEKGAAARKERAAFDGQDIGECARCHQKVDSAHIEAEIKRLDELIESLTTDWNAANEKVTQVEARVKAKADILGTMVEQERLARDAAHAAELHATRAAGATTKLAAARTAADTATATLTEAEGKVAPLETIETEKAQALAEAVTRDTNAAEALTKAQQANTRAAGLRGALDEKGARLKEIATTLVREKLDHEMKLERLETAVKTAKSAFDGQAFEKAAIVLSLDKAREELEAATTTLTTRIVDLSQIENGIAAVETRITNARARIDEIELAATARKEAEQNLAIAAERAEIDAMAAELLDPRKGLPIHLIDEALPQLEDRMNHFISELGMSYLTVTLSTLDGDKESLLILVDNGRPGRKLDAAAFSGGERDRIEYAAKCALGELAAQSRGVQFGLQYFDEPSEGLDAAGKAELIRLMVDRCATEYPVTLVTSHDPAIKSAFPMAIRFKKNSEGRTVMA